MKCTWPMQIKLSCTQRELYSTGSRWVRRGRCWVRVAFQIPTCWYRQRESLVLGSRPNVKPQHEWFHVAVEFRFPIILHFGCHYFSYVNITIKSKLKCCCYSCVCCKLMIMFE